MLTQNILSNQKHTYLHNVFIDLLWVPVDQVNLLGVTIPQDFLLVGVILVRHIGGLWPKTGQSRIYVLQKCSKGRRVKQTKLSPEGKVSEWPHSPLVPVNSPICGLTTRLECEGQLHWPGLLSLSLAHADCLTQYVTLLYPHP